MLDPRRFSADCTTHRPNERPGNATFDLVMSVFITERRSGISRHRFSRFDVFMATLRSYALLVPLERLYLYVQLDRQFLHMAGKFRQAVHLTFGQRLRVLQLRRLTTQEEWRKAMSVIAPSGPLSRDDRLIWFLQNDDHPFVDTSQVVLQEGLNRLQADHAHFRTLFMSHWPGALLLSGKVERPHRCGSFAVARLTMLDSVQVMNLGYLKWLLLELDWRNKSVLRIDHLVLQKQVMGGFASRASVVSAVDRSLQTMYVPLRELCRKFDGYAHIWSGAIPESYVPPLTLPLVASNMTPPVGASSSEKMQSSRRESRGVDVATTGGVNSEASRGGRITRTAHENALVRMMTSARRGAGFWNRNNSWEVPEDWIETMLRLERSVAPTSPEVGSARFLSGSIRSARSLMWRPLDVKDEPRSKGAVDHIVDSRRELRPCARPGYERGCFSVCNISQVAALLLRLPTLDAPQGVWWRYLRRVYSGYPPPLPFDLRDLEVLRLDYLPMKPCISSSISAAKSAISQPTSDTASLNACNTVVASEHDSLHAQSTCNGPGGWLTSLRPEPSRREVNAFIANRSWLGSRPYSLGFAGFQRPHEERKIVSNGSWVEVARRPVLCSRHKRHVLRHIPCDAEMFPEGSRGYGCWLVPAIGSGVFVNVGRTAAFSSRREARLAGLRFSVRSDPRLDELIGNSTRTSGFDSLQLLRGNSLPYGERTLRASELLLVAAGCMERLTPLPGVCVPVQLRSGWQAKVACSCQDSVGGERAHTLNCEGGARAGRSLRRLSPHNEPV